MTVYDHEQNKLHDACGISKEKVMQLLSDFRKETEHRKITDGLPPTSKIIELIENMDNWNTTEKLYVMFKYGEFTEQATSLIAAESLLGNLLGEITGETTKKGISVSDWQHKVWKEK